MNTSSFDADKETFALRPLLTPIAATSAADATVLPVIFRTLPACCAVPQTDTGSWIQKTTRIKFSLGGLLLGRTKLPALVLDTHFSKLTTDPAKPWPPLETAPPEIRTAVIKSHPVECNQRRITFVDQQLLRYIPHQYRRFYVSLEGCFQGYLKKFSGQRRNHFSRTVRKFARANKSGSIDWREYRRPEEMEDFHRLGRAVSSKTYQEKLTDSGLPDTEDFRAQMKELAGKDQVRGYILFFDGTPIAYEYCPAVCDVLHHWKVGYDPDYRQHSPGNVLLYLTIEKLFAEKRFRIFDFGSGEFGYKEVFATDNALCADIYYFRRDLRNWLLVLSHTAINVAFDFAACVLDLLHLRQPLKRLLRGHG